MVELADYFTETDKVYCSHCQKTFSYLENVVARWCKKCHKLYQGNAEQCPFCETTKTDHRTNLACPKCLYETARIWNAKK